MSPLTPLPLSHYPIMGEVVIYPSLHSPEVLYMCVCVCVCSSSPLAIVTTTCVQCLWMSLDYCEEMLV